MGLVLRNLENKNEILLEEGVPLVIGRGDTTGCSDKRVSRKHSQLVCTSENKLQVVALHTNPCFIMKSGLPPMLHLKKDEEKVLEEGDYFGLLPEAFWFEIVKKDYINCTSIKDKESDKTELKYDVTPGKKSPAKLSVHDKPGTSSNNPLPKVTVSQDSSETKTKVTPELENTRKLPLWMYEIDESKETKKSPGKRPHSLNSEDSGGKKIKTELSPIVGRTSPSPERQINVSEDVKVEVSDNDSNPDRNKQNIDADKPKTENVDQAQATPKKEETKDEAESSNKKNEKDGYESDVAEPEEPTANSSSSRRRPICQYEGSCYRKNPQHKQEYCHPGDADYVRPENRPQCPYGASCYRQNPMHRAEYQHPTSTPASRPQPQSPASPGEERPPCQYGSLCYRQNPQHRRDFYHPPRGYSFVPQSCPWPSGGFTLPYIIVVPRWSAFNNSNHSSKPFEASKTEEKSSRCDSTTHPFGDREENDESDSDDSDSDSVNEFDDSKH